MSNQDDQLFKEFSNLISTVSKEVLSDSVAPIIDNTSREWQRDKRQVIDNLNDIMTVMKESAEILQGLRYLRDFLDSIKETDKTYQETLLETEDKIQKNQAQLSKVLIELINSSKDVRQIVDEFSSAASLINTFTKNEIKSLVDSIDQEKQQTQISIKNFGEKCEKSLDYNMQQYITITNGNFQKQNELLRRIDTDTLKLKSSIEQSDQQNIQHFEQINKFQVEQRWFIVSILSVLILIFGMNIYMLVH